jgi:hypothetical protein
MGKEYRLKTNQSTPAAVSQVQKCILRVTIRFFASVCPVDPQSTQNRSLRQVSFEVAGKLLPRGRYMADISRTLEGKVEIVV